MLARVPVGNTRGRRSEAFPTRRTGPGRIRALGKRPHATGDVYGLPSTDTQNLYNNNKVRCRRPHVTATASITTPPVAKNAPAPARCDTFCPKYAETGKAHSGVSDQSVTATASGRTNIVQTYAQINQ